MRSRSAAKGAGSTGAAEDAGELSTETPFLNVCARERPRTEASNGRQGIVGDTGEIAASRREDQHGASRIQSHIEPNLLELRENLFGSEMLNADKSFACSPSEDRTQASPGSIPTHVPSGMARVVSTTASRRPSGESAHAAPTRSDGIAMSKTSWSAGSARLAAQDGAASGNAWQASRLTATFADSRNETPTSDRSIGPYVVGGVGMDRGEDRALAPIEGRHGAVVWEQVESVSMDEHPTTSDMGEVGLRSPPTDIPSYERTSRLPANRLTVVVHSEESGDVEVQITIRGDDARIGIVASADVARSIERNQSLLEGSIHSSTGLNAAISVTAGDGLEGFGSLMRDGGGDRPPLPSNFSENAPERERAPNQSGSGNKRDQSSAPSTARKADASSFVRGSRIL